MRFASLGSGSRGNATLISTTQTTLMVDCGFSVRETCKRLEALDTDPASIDALLVTHEHSDHIKGVAPFARRFGMPVWASRGTAQYFHDDDIDIGVINVHQVFQVGDIKVEPVPVPHDAREPCQFVFSANDLNFGLLTDVGSMTRHIIESYMDCDAMLLEFNHDEAMLSGSVYPPSVRKRIAGDLGHLSNSQSCRILSELLPGKVRLVVAGHLSESNNSRGEVRSKIDSVINGHACRFDIAGQHEPSGWYALDAAC